MLYQFPQHLELLACACPDYTWIILDMLELLGVCLRSKLNQHSKIIKSPVIVHCGYICICNENRAGVCMQALPCNLLSFVCWKVSWYEFDPHQLTLSLRFFRCRSEGILNTAQSHFWQAVQEQLCGSTGKRNRKNIFHFLLLS